MSNSGRPYVVTNSAKQAELPPNPRNHFQAWLEQLWITASLRKPVREAVPTSKGRVTKWKW